MRCKEFNIPIRFTLFHLNLVKYSNIVRSQSDNDQIRDYFLALYKDQYSIQIGLNMMKIRGQWYTIHNHRQVPIEYSNWARGHPEGTFEVSLFQTYFSVYNQLRSGYDGTVQKGSYSYSCVSPVNMLQFFCIKNTTTIH